MTGTKSEARAHVLGGELRALRREAGLSQRTLADRMDRAHTVLVRWERGQRIPDSTGIEAFARALSLTVVERDRLVQLAREAADEPVNEVSAGAAGQTDVLDTLIKFEQVATGITTVSNALVSGLMQTAAYARLAIGDSPEIQTKVATRIGRRDVITRDRDPARYTAYLLETVLHQRIGHDVMCDQLRLIQRLGDLPNVSVRIIPEACGLTPAHTGSFALLEFAKADSIVHMEHLSSAVLLRDRDDVEAHRTALSSLDELALSPKESNNLIADVIDKMETTA
ncbi:helix-turn-helix domain-containing protein [Saccharomonospora halophila]|uniref:helix-turn-helix domain-containing protein n=1 Tax=Saccharomonospora halophila TaxID=129922 RepID=UPI00048A766C|nr:helix-turn-helix transcriptional regulator [Saccharomonospora halophila]